MSQKINNLHQTIQSAANIAIIIVTVLLAGVAVARYMQPARSDPSTIARAESRKVTPGTKIQLANVDYGKSDKTLVMVLSTTCRFCTASVPFYQKLAQRKEGHEDLRLIAVTPQSVDEAKEYLGKHGVAVDEIAQASLDEMDVSGTPTLIQVDKTGAAVRSWVGKLPPEKEAEVVQSLFGSD
jgi:thioredoxin-related protein